MAAITGFYDVIEVYRKEKVDSEAQLFIFQRDARGCATLNLPADSHAGLLRVGGRLVRTRKKKKFGIFGLQMN